MKPKKLLVIGATGLIGRSVHAHALERGWAVEGTCHSRRTPGLQDLNLAKAVFQSFDFQAYSHVLIAAGLSNIEQCYLQQEKTAEVNVRGTIKLIKAVHSSGALPIFISSDYVFEGTCGNYSEEDARHPTTVYGRQKVEVEDFMRKEIHPHLILRFGKIVSTRQGDDTFFMQWYQQLKKGEKIRVASDQITSLLDLEDMLHCFEGILMQDLTGTYHVATGLPTSKMEVAVALCKYHHLDPSLIETCSIRSMGLREERPLNTYLNSDKIKRETGYAFRTLHEMVQSIPSGTTP